MSATEQVHTTESVSSALVPLQRPLTIWDNKILALYVTALFISVGIEPMVLLPSEGSRANRFLLPLQIYH
jgi:hypothetical protein